MERPGSRQTLQGKRPHEKARYGLPRHFVQNHAPIARNKGGFRVRFLLRVYLFK